MQTWVTLAAKHATLASGFGLGTIPAMGWDSLDGVAVGFLLAGAGFAAVNSSRQARSCPLPPAAATGSASVESSRQQDRPLTRIRRRVDGLLTSMLSDDAEPAPARSPVLVPVPSAAELPPAQPAYTRPAWRGDYVDAVAGPAGSRSELSVAATGRTLFPAASGGPGLPERVGNWPYLTVVRDTDDEPVAAARPAGPAIRAGDPEFWGSRLPQPASGDNRWRHRSDGASRRSGTDGPAGPVRDGGDQRGAGSDSAGFGRDRAGAGSDRAGGGSAGSGSAGEGATGKGRDTNSNPRSADRKRPAPRHAAPPAGFGATLGRRLTSPRLTSKSAAHAG